MPHRSDQQWQAASEPEGFRIGLRGCVKAPPFNLPMAGGQDHDRGTGCLVHKDAGTDWNRPVRSRTQGGGDGEERNPNAVKAAEKMYLNIMALLALS